MQRLDRIARHVAPLCASAAALAAAPLFHDQVAVVTGSGQGIGRSAALLFAAHGAAVCVSDLDAAKSAAVAAEITAAGGRALSFPGDVTSADFADNCLRATVERFGKVTVVVNNAGYTWDQVIHKTEPKHMDAMMAVHVTAVYRMVKACGTYMREPAKNDLQAGRQPEPRCIINISSTSGTHGNAGQLNYSAAKSAVLGMTKTICKEWGAFNIRCNAIAFGRIATRLTAEKQGGDVMALPSGERVALGIPGASKETNFDAIPLRRIGTPEEAAGAILMLSSPWASYVTGQVLEVTGGALV